MAGERQQVRLAVAEYFGGTLVTDGEVKFQGGPLTAYGLGTAYPYTVRGFPDSDYTAGMPSGQNWGAVMSTTALARTSIRDSYGGGTSGWRAVTYRVTCLLQVLAETEHLETAGAGLDDLLEQCRVLIAADRTLGTTGGAYASLPGGRLIIQAGEGRNGITDETEPMVLIDPVKGRSAGGARLIFDVLTMTEG
jgi:hypothetical protein